MTKPQKSDRKSMSHHTSKSSCRHGELRELAESVQGGTGERSLTNGRDIKSPRRSFTFKGKIPIQLCFVIYYEVYFLFFKRFLIKILFIYYQRGKEGEREGEKHQCVVASHTLSTWGPGPQPRQVP